MALSVVGYVHFKIIAADISDFMNKLRNSGFSVHNVRAEGGKYISGDIHWYSLDELKALVSENSAQLETVSRRGIIFKAMDYRRRAGILIGAVLAAAMVALLSNTVLVIEVYGNESMSDAQIISVMNDYGISVGKFIPSLDLRRCERQIITAFDKFSWIGIRSVGCRILVEVSEMAEAPDMVPTSRPCNVISAKDAQIVEIRSVYMGMLVPMLYDGVKKGDLLISGTVDGKLDHDYYVHAMGEIIGRYDEKETFFQPYSDGTVNYSEKYEKKSLYLFGARIPLYIGTAAVGEYEYDETLDYLKILNLSLPVGIITSEYKPYTVDEVIYTREQAKVILEGKISNYEKNFIEGEELTVIGKKTDFKEKNNGLEVTVTYTLEGDIGVTQEIMAKY